MRKTVGFAQDYVPAPRPAPIPSPRRDAYYSYSGKGSPGHSRALSAATTQVSSGRASPDPRRSSVRAGAGAAGSGEGMEDALPERTQRRSIPHPSSSSVAKKTKVARFEEVEGVD